MAKIGENEQLFYENTIAQTMEIETAAKRALYWTNDPEVASQLALVLSAAWRIRAGVIDRTKSRHEEVRSQNGKVNQ